MYIIHNVRIQLLGMRLSCCDSGNKYKFDAVILRVVAELHIQGLANSLRKLTTDPNECDIEGLLRKDIKL